MYKLIKIFNVKEDGNEVKFTEIFSELSEELKRRRSGEISEFEFPYNGDYSEDDIIRKLIGNGSLSECLQDYENRYLWILNGLFTLLVTDCM